MRKYLFPAICAMALGIIAASCGNNSKKAESEAEQAAREDSLRQAEKMAEAEALMQKLEEEPIFDIQTNLGMIKVKLYSKTPKHKANFEKLALSGFYDGILFHRVIDGFMIQGGDPNTKDTTLVEKYGQGGPGYTIPAEIIPDYRHKKGALAAARRGDAANPERESSGSQFYLVQSEETCAQLDGAYTVFGETVEGLDVIDRIAKVATDRRDRPISDVRIISIKLDPICVPQEKEAADSSKTE
ncbi:MAG: peptidylprolyl isomerase [Candidatus Cryptobacteroides sp.]|nr:peptidylprolyl isomerase [Candidatus Cryptobacteroides sp.]